MGIISKIEEKLGDITEALFLLRKGIDPLAIEIALRRQIERKRKNLFGKIVVPNQLSIVLDASCYDENEAFFDKFGDMLAKNLQLWMREKGYETVEAMVFDFETGSVTGKPFDIIVSFAGRVDSLRGEGRAVLAVLQNSKSGKKIALYHEYTIIGRGTDCQIRISDRTVSERHACLYSGNGKMIIEDMGSTNGTRVNREIIQKRVLKESDRIKIGDTELIYA